MRCLKFYVAAVTAALLFASCDDSTSVNSAADSEQKEFTRIDTVYVRDTVNIRDTISSSDTVTVKDTVTVNDTISVKDTVVNNDTLTLNDTLVVKDTITLHDTIIDCTTKDNGDGSVTLTCGETSQILYPAICNGRSYDANTQICEQGVVKDVCNGIVYDKDVQLCENGNLYDYFTDTRDNQIYKMVTIGEQTWMAQNLNFKVDSSWCGGGKHWTTEEGDCNVYGRLYSWSTALNISDEYDTTQILDHRYGVNGKYYTAILVPDVIQKPHRGLCPVGWHLPDIDEWQALYNYVMEQNPDVPYDVQMKSDSLWVNEDNPNIKTGAAQPGMNLTGFNALPAGSRIKTKLSYASSERNGQFSNEHNITYFITTTDYGDEHYRYQAFYGYNMNGGAFVVAGPGNGYTKSIASSVRCLKDVESD